ncbi:hypothetical protein ACFT5B_17945 [Luteimicrobium sp. NPDC057192]|uniref:hypothetical protein n=1 Tax=Luteimicrobium sp. NPDC057192 TaxID=3346042 RepID=UPI00362C984F
MTDRFAKAKLFVMPLLATHDAARRLEVTTRQVQHLVAQGKLASPAHGVIDGQSVDRFLAAHGTARQRAWSEPTAWGAVAILSGVTPLWLGPSQRSRLKKRLRTLTAAELVRHARDRAEVSRYAGHSAALARLRKEVVDTSRAAATLGLAATESVDGYVSADHLSRLVTDFALAPDETGRITLRSTTFPIDTVRELADTGAVLAALDLAESLDVRERRAGLDGLAAALERLRG